AHLPGLGGGSRAAAGVGHAVVAAVRAAGIGTARVARRARALERALAEAIAFAVELHADTAVALHVLAARLAEVELLRHAQRDQLAADVDGSAVPALGTAGIAWVGTHV